MLPPYSLKMYVAKFVSNYFSNSLRVEEDEDKPYPNPIKLIIYYHEEPGGTIVLLDEGVGETTVPLPYFLLYALNTVVRFVFTFWIVMILEQTSNFSLMPLSKYSTPVNLTIGTNTVTMQYKGGTRS